MIFLTIELVYKASRLANLANLSGGKKVGLIALYFSRFVTDKYSTQNINITDNKYRYPTCVRNVS